MASRWSTSSPSWPEAPVEACVTVGSQAPLLYTFDAIPSMPYDEADPPHLPVPWLNIYDTRDFLSFLAEPLFRRTDGLASVVDLRVRSGRDFPRSHSAYWELGAGLGRDRDGLHLAADRAADGQGSAPARVRGATGAGPARCRRRLDRPRPKLTDALRAAPAGQAGKAGPCLLADARRPDLVRNAAPVTDRTVTGVTIRSRRP